jgi:NADPH2:quinone reductase
MKAVLCKTWGGPETLVIEDVPSLVPEAGELVIDVKSASVNFPDVLMIQGKYQLKPALPFTPGSEAAGVVRAVGEGVEGFAVGDRVLSYVVLGAFAEEVRIAADRVVKMPPGVADDVAASFILTYGTTHHALIDRAGLKAGETLLVLGAAGGVGLAAVEIGKLLGAKVIAAASSGEKLAVCRSRGADETINYATEDLRERLKAVTGGKGVDVVYDPVGGSYTELALRSMAWRGRFLVVGFANGEIPRIPLNLALLKGCAIVGVFWGEFTRKEAARARAGLEELLGWLAAGRLRPHVSAQFPLSRTADALRAMQSRTVTGKIVIHPEAD